MNLCYPLAAEGDAPAQFNLELMYRHGQDVPQDFQEALKWHRKAAEQGDMPAQLNLGLLYGQGRGVPQDFVRAHMWYSIGAKASSGDERRISLENRDNVASQMTATQIGKAHEMARRCQETKFKECD
jgi:TPR repeat protein